MKKGLIGMILLCSMLMGCASSAKNSHPKLLYSPTPAYPYYALANRIEGDVRVRYNVGVDGNDIFQTPGSAWLNSIAE